MFWGSKFLISIIWVFQKNEYFLEYEGFVDIYIFFFFWGGGVIKKIGLYLGASSMHFRYRMGDIWGGGGVLEISDIFWWARAYI